MYHGVSRMYLEKKYKGQGTLTSPFLDCPKTIPHHAS